MNFIDPKEVLKPLKLKEDMIAADFGSGSGGWAIPLAKELEMGKVFAIDILEEPLSALRAKLKLEKIKNVDVIQSDEEETEGSTLAANSCNLVLMTNLLFQVENIPRVLLEAKRVLKPGGRILVVDWKEKAALGPQGRRVLPEQVYQAAKDLGLKVEKEFDASLYHYGLILAKSR